MMERYSAISDKIPDVAVNAVKTLSEEGIKDNYKLEESLKAEGFHEDEINKIMGENWIRVLKEQM